MWDLPGPGLEPVSPALSGGFLTIASPGKASKFKFKWPCMASVYHTGQHHCSRLAWPWRSSISQTVWLVLGFFLPSPKAGPTRRPILKASGSLDPEAFLQDDWKNCEVQSHHQALHNLTLGNTAQEHSG